VRTSKRLAAVGGTVLAGGALSLGLVGPSSAQAPANRPLEGDFSLIQMIHTTASTPNFTVPATNPWNGFRTKSERFTYRGIPCTGAAPVNNIASDLASYGSRVQGSRSPASLRSHPFRIRLRVSPKGGWEMLGRITLTVCKLSGGPTAAPDPVPDADKPKIDVRFKARFKRHSVENINWSGTFTLNGGTGRYEDLEGSGQIAGYFFCFNPEGCGRTGRNYLDGQFVMHGDYRDPTPQLAG